MPSYLKLVDTDTPGPRYDVTPLFADHQAFSALVADLGSHFDGADYDVVAGIDALGFILGTALALRAGKGFIPIRKGGKLPVEVNTLQFVDYSGKTKSLELRRDAIKPGTRVLVADEWVETGAQVEAATRLVEGQGGIIAGIAAINIDDSPTTRLLRAKYDCYTVWEEPS